MTHPRYAAEPVTLEQAWEQVDRILAVPEVWIPQPTEKHAGILKELSLQAAATGNLLMDAHLAALAIEHGLILCSTNTDFARFKKLRWENPLLA